MSNKKLTDNEQAIKNIIEKIERGIARAMNGPNGEMCKGGSEDYLNGLITAFRIVEKFDPDPPPKCDEDNFMERWVEYQLEHRKANTNNQQRDEEEKVETEIVLMPTYKPKKK